jgi:hypothetical protein
MKLSILTALICSLVSVAACSDGVDTGDLQVVHPAATGHKAPAERFNPQPDPPGFNPQPDPPGMTPQ